MQWKVTKSYNILFSKPSWEWLVFTVNKGSQTEQMSFGIKGSSSELIKVIIYLAILTTIELHFITTLERSVTVLVVGKVIIFLTYRNTE